MSIRHLLSSTLIAMICLSLVAGTAMAQRPLGSIIPDGGAQDPGQNPDEEPLVVRPSQDDSPRRSFTAPQDRDATQDQVVVINSKYAGWEEVSSDNTGARVSDQIRGNWIMVDPNGRFYGTVSAGKDADVTNMNVFLLNMGRLVKQTAIGTDGRFEFNNVRQGAYSLVGWGDKGFFSFGLNILAYNPDNAGAVASSVNTIAYQNKTTINTDWIRYFAPRVTYRVFGRYETGEGRDDPARLFGFEGLVAHLPQSLPATSISGRPVARTADGRLIGRVHQLNSINGRPVDVRSSTVMLFQGDEVVASTATDNYGAFEFLEVPNGSYGLTAVGVDGVGMISIDVVSGNSGDSAIDFTMISSETVGWLNHYASDVAYRRALLAPRPPSAEDNQAMAGFGCPTCGNQPGGCPACQGAYNKSCCKSRGISFEQWAANGCHCDPAKFGDGTVLAGIARQLRKNQERVEGVFDKAFYENDQYNFDGSNSNQLYPNQPYPQQQYPQQ